MMGRRKDYGHIIYFLKLGQQLPEFYFQMAAYFKENGHTLLPVALGQLLELTKGHQEIFYVVTFATHKEHEKFYNARVRKVMKLLGHSKRSILYVGSSFDSMNDSMFLSTGSNYHFLKLPLHIERFCQIVDNGIRMQDEHPRRFLDDRASIFGPSF